MISVAIADDQPLVRSGLRMIVEGEAEAPAQVHEERLEYQVANEEE